MRRLRLPHPSGDLTLRLRDEPDSAQRSGAPFLEPAPSGDRPPLLCLHGAAMSSVVFMDLVRHAAPRRRVIAPDLPGHGQSTPALAAISIDAYRDVILALLDHLAIPRAVLVGHSMGAAIALRLALARPERVAGLVLLNGAARLKVSADLLAQIAQEPPPQEDTGAVSERMPEGLAALSFSPWTATDRRERWQAVLRGATPEVALGDFRACDGFDVRAALPTLRVATLVVSGDEDHMVPPRLQEELARLLPGARLLPVPRTGHLSHLEAPDAVLPAVVEFARDL